MTDSLTSARIRRLVIGVSIAIFVVPVVIVAVIEVAARSGRREIADGVAAAAREAVTGDPAAIAHARGVRIWIVDPAAYRVIAASDGQALGAAISESRRSASIPTGRSSSKPAARRHGSASTSRSRRPPARRADARSSATTSSCSARPRCGAVMARSRSPSGSPRASRRG